MKRQEAFLDFLEKVVNLNPDRVKRIREANRILTEFISKTDDFKDLLIDTIPQGSSRQKTIIKPTGSAGTFDSDLMIRLKENPEWEPKDYLIKLAAAFRASGKYEDITDTNGKNRCVTIDYEGDFHVDLVPAVQQPDGSYSICNKKTNKLEPTDGDGYAVWFEQQDSSSKNTLVFDVRLIKFLRDDKEKFDTKSIILTTIAANQITPVDAIAGAYQDIPNSLSSVLTKMNSYLAQFDSPPTVSNPAMPSENFNRHWKDDIEGFNKFKSAISSYAQTAKEANETEDDDESLKIWKKLFGDKFGNEDSGSPADIPKKGNVFAVPITPTRQWSHY